MSVLTDESPKSFDAAQEYRIAWYCVIAVLVTLTVVKPLAGIPFVGTVAITGAALLQLYLPLWRCGKLGRDWDFVGLHLQTWRMDLKWFLLLCLVTFPPFFLAHHLYMLHAHDWLNQLGLEWVANFVHPRVLAPELPAGWEQWWEKGKWIFTITATHVLGVALPEETFYRGYLQPRLEARLGPKTRIFGVLIGRAALLAAALFALGHVLGEWNPLRLGPFFPALLFAWQRNATGSVVGAIAYHASCNILGEILFSLYKPV
ncbi:MAG: hypothetical protein A2289_15575 [Deltaproteobacteria bacterium RIFOXYA12_FULL_58_15]|nr:MAG: hypothetical protein A2289_15575 [Deltaproteobacteria bacterium RIFOXYA12_FULL_58_15]OGR14650.1 MAG: hypothetical protein A2341_22180 [Deltaproteobacteria bacterium RIFOXYB12_FULL_58_9]